MANAQYTAEYRRFRKLLIFARKNAGLTQQQLADRLGKPQSYIAKIEGGERRIDVLEFARLAEAVEADPAEMLRQITKGG